MKYIDLGLPSGTLWAEHNEEGYYTFNKAVEIYGDSLPTKEQFEELKNNCRWEWWGDGYKVTSPNGNSIVLPAAGFIGCNGGVFCVGSHGRYWSSTPYDSENACRLDFNSIGVGIYYNYRFSGESIRLVKSNNKNNDMKDKKLNIAEILKDCPKGTKLYAITLGECTFECINNKISNYPITVRADADECTYSFTAYGKMLNVTKAECQLFPSKENRDWSTFKAPKKEHEFKPFEKVLVRDTDISCWTAGLFSHILHDDNTESRLYTVNGVCWKMCIPYEGNEHLLGTTNSPDEKGGKE